MKLLNINIMINIYDIYNIYTFDVYMPWSELNKTCIDVPEYVCTTILPTILLY